MLAALAAGLVWFRSTPSQRPATYRNWPHSTSRRDGVSPRQKGWFFGLSVLAFVVTSLELPMFFGNFFGVHLVVEDRSGQVRLLVSNAYAIRMERR